MLVLRLKERQDEFLQCVHTDRIGALPKSVQASESSASISTQPNMSGQRRLPRMGVCQLPLNILQAGTAATALCQDALLA